MSYQLRCDNCRKDLGKQDFILYSLDTREGHDERGIASLLVQHGPRTHLPVEGMHWCSGECCGATLTAMYHLTTRGVGWTAAERADVIAESER